MIYLKTSEDIKLMSKAGEIAAGALEVAQKFTKPGVSTFFVDKMIYSYIKSKGAIPSCLNYYGFPASSCISVNNQVVHGIPNKEFIIKQGDIVSVDLTVLYRGFHADNAATFAVGEVSKEAQRLIDVTKTALARALEKAVAGNRMGDISFAVQNYVESNGFSVVRDYVGHGIGRRMHESPSVPNFGVEGKGPKLEVGMTLAIEPMVNAGSFKVRTLEDGWTVVTQDDSLSAHFEHTIAITEKKPLILTQK